jgi:phage baseplate assembly protein W
MDERRFGWGLAVEDGDIAFDPPVPDRGRPLRAVSGQENLVQALELRLLTPAGDDRFNTLYGLDYAQVFGSPEGVRAARELLRMNVVRTLATDARVHDVREVRFGDDAGRTGRLAVEAVVETGDSDEVSLRLGVGGGAT